MNWLSHLWWWVEVHTGTVNESGPYYGSCVVRWSDGLHVFGTTQASGKSEGRCKESDLRLRTASAPLGTIPRHRRGESRRLRGDVSILPLPVRSGSRSTGCHARTSRSNSGSKDRLVTSHARGTIGHCSTSLGDQAC